MKKIKSKMFETVKPTKRALKYGIVHNIMKHKPSSPSPSSCTDAIREDKRRFSRARIYKVHKKDQQVAESGGRANSEYCLGWCVGLLGQIFCWGGGGPLPIGIPSVVVSFLPLSLLGVKGQGCRGGQGIDG
eukprot:5829011-Amphidinium_carterae.1